MYKILIIDDHPLVRDGVRLLLAGLDARVELFEAGDCEAALGQLPAIGRLDLVLLDLGLPGTGGLAGIPLFRRALADTPIMVLSASEKADDVRQAFAAGARGYLPKSCGGEVMCEAIHQLLSGRVYLPPSVALADDRPAAPAAAPTESVPLTPRQLEVLTLVTRGSPNKEIARRLNMAEGTVRVHLSAIFKALEVNNRTEAAYAANRLGLVVDPSGASSAGRG
ncbi:response regulator [Endothiovibrio diazotrophicus]